MKILNLIFFIVIISIFSLSILDYAKAASSGWVPSDRFGVGEIECENDFYCLKLLGPGSYCYNYRCRPCPPPKPPLCKTWNPQGGCNKVEKCGNGMTCDNNGNCLAVAVCIDKDNDGYGDPGSDKCKSKSLITDCDDNNAAINPAAKEICSNKKDDNCDSLADCLDSSCANDVVCKQDTSTRTSTPTTTTTTTTTPTPTTTTPTPTTTTPTTETSCNPSCIGDLCGQSNGCGSFCPSTDKNTAGKCSNPLCIDKDNDGYGNPGDVSCQKGSAIDCDDNNANINPSQKEICSNNLDDNCNAKIDCQDEACFGSISGNVKNTDNKNIDSAKVESYQYAKQKYSAYTQPSGKYQINNVLCGNYDMIASADNYLSSTKTNINVPAESTATVDFILNPANICEDDCTYNSDNLIHKECDNINGCKFYDDIAKKVCDFAQPGWIRSYSETKEIECAEGTPKDKIILKATVTCEKENMIKITKVVSYKGKLVKLITVACG